MPLPKGTQPEYVGGRRNKYFRGYDTTPQTAVPIDMIKKDLMNIAMDLNNTANKAAKSIYEGDREEYEKLKHETASIYATYIEWENITQAIDSGNQDAINAYIQFRHDNQLDQEHESHNITRKYRTAYNEECIQEALSAIEDELNEYCSRPSAKQEHINNYKEKIRGEQPQKSREETHPETKEFPIIIEPDGTAYRSDPYDNQIVDHEDNIDNYYNKPPQRREIPEDDYRRTGYKKMSNGRYIITGDPKNKTKRKFSDSSNRKEPGLITDIENKLGIGNLGSLFVTWRPRVGPFRINFGRKGLTSIGLHAGPITYRVYSRKDKTGLSSVNLPGGVSWRGKRVSKNNNETESLSTSNIIGKIQNIFR